MYQGQTVFAQLMDYLPYKTFERYVQRYQGEHRVRSFSCWDQFLCLAFAVARFRCFWLTIHCQGRTEEVLKYLAPYGSAEFMARAAEVKPTSFRVMKTEALAGDFLGWTTPRCSASWTGCPPGTGWIVGFKWAHVTNRTTSSGRSGRWRIV